MFWCCFFPLLVACMDHLASAPTQEYCLTLLPYVWLQWLLTSRIPTGMSVFRSPSSVIILITCTGCVFKEYRFFAIPSSPFTFPSTKIQLAQHTNCIWCHWHQGLTLRKPVNILCPPAWYVVWSSFQAPNHPRILSVHIYICIIYI